MTDEDRIDDLLGEIRNLQRRVHDLEATLVPASAIGEPAASGFLFPTAAEFAEDWLFHHIERRVSATGSGDAAWCKTWWRHPEAVLRVSALWRSFEAARLDPYHGVANWIVTQLDPQVVMLNSRRGPLGRCNAERCSGGDSLPLTPIPAEHVLRASSSPQAIHT